MGDNFISLPEKYFPFKSTFRSPSRTETFTQRKTNKLSFYVALPPARSLWSHIEDIKKIYIDHTFDTIPHVSTNIRIYRPLTEKEQEKITNLKQQWENLSTKHASRGTKPSLPPPPPSLPDYRKGVEIRNLKNEITQITIFSRKALTEEAGQQHLQEAVQRYRAYNLDYIPFQLSPSPPPPPPAMHAEKKTTATAKTPDTSLTIEELKDITPPLPPSFRRNAPPPPPPHALVSSSSLQKSAANTRVASPPASLRAQKTEWAFPDVAETSLDADIVEFLKINKDFQPSEKTSALTSRPLSNRESQSSPDPRKVTYASLHTELNALLSPSPAAEKKISVEVPVTDDLYATYMLPDSLSESQDAINTRISALIRGFILEKEPENWSKDQEAFEYASAFSKNLFRINFPDFEGENPYVRKYATRILPTLIDALDSRDERVRDAVANSLSMIANFNQDALPPLLKYVQQLPDYNGRSIGRYRYFTDEVCDILFTLAGNRAESEKNNNTSYLNYTCNDYISSAIEASQDNPRYYKELTSIYASVKSQHKLFPPVSDKAIRIVRDRSSFIRNAPPQQQTILEKDYEDLLQLLELSQTPPDETIVIEHIQQPESEKDILRTIEYLQYMNTLSPELLAALLHWLEPDVTLPDTITLSDQYKDETLIAKIRGRILTHLKPYALTYKNQLTAPLLSMIKTDSTLFQHHAYQFWNSYIDLLAQLTEHDNILRHKVFDAVWEYRKEMPPPFSPFGMPKYSMNAGEYLILRLGDYRNNKEKYAVRHSKNWTTQHYKDSLQRQIITANPVLKNILLKALNEVEYYK